MLQYIIKVILSALIIVAVSEIGKRSSLFGALVAALPLTSLLAIVWMRLEKVGTDQIARLSGSIFWLVIPSLLFFILFPFLLNRGMAFWFSFAIAAVSTTAAYLLMSRILTAAGIQL
ncbi:DUF3147 family protein [Spirochaeta isovalerica]|uniref:Nitrogen fixation/metabolism regulation signal transduction histidine kinase n=1 Tax=Spirochaeta isovalerica TaxID=150 RepID=A0A841RAV3_9SPIO|nr:DUF3147 family protein [Spirochaeta isovalerica]MBB6480049.1 nitrogen fixation/metabolism regulation signal transduction histidine kinase [Spirochaeta isovalerica]